MSAEHDYWADCLAEAAEQCNLILTKEQESHIAKALAGAHECHGMAFPQPRSNYPSEITKLEKALAAERNKRGCPDCAGRGRVDYMAGPWHCNSDCETCHGEGKIAA